MVVFTLFGVIFGGLHCIGWNFRFPTHSEHSLWQSTSLAITAIPLIIAPIDFLLATRLCNGTRMVITHMGNRVLEVRLIGGERDGQMAFIPCISIIPRPQPSIVFSSNDFNFLLVLPLPLPSTKPRDSPCDMLASICRPQFFLMDSCTLLFLKQLQATT